MPAPTRLRRFIISPNRSFSWGLTAVLFGLLGIWLGAVAVFTLYHKTWPILAFAGLELLGLAVAFAVHSHKSRAYEELVMTRDTLTLTRHYPSGRTSLWQAPLAWTHIVKPAKDDERSPLRLAYAGQACEFGTLITAEERQSLANSLHAAQRALQLGKQDDAASLA